VLEGEITTWQLTVNDGVNPPVSSILYLEVASYDFSLADTLRLSRAIWTGNIADRNTAPPSSPLAGWWGALGISTMYTNLSSIKRVSILQGSSPPLYDNDRYLLISPYSVTVFVHGAPFSILRKLFLPSPGSFSPPAPPPLVVDAVHTEEDYTLVLGDDNSLYRFSVAPLINTDNPDSVLSLAPFSSMVFNRVLATVGYAGNRVLAFSGQDGCLLMQVGNADTVPLAVLEINTSSQLLYGADNVQFVRLSNVESVRTGQVLVGTIGADGNTYETLVDLTKNAIVGTWDKSEVVNQTVTTGEILFQPEDAYSGQPSAPVLNAPTDNGPSSFTTGFELIGLSWVQARPDLCSGYTVQFSVDGSGIWQVASTIRNGVVESTILSFSQGHTYSFRVQALSDDGNSGYSNVAAIAV
jgi:hypothetical protein